MKNFSPKKNENKKELKEASFFQYRQQEKKEDNWMENNFLMRNLKKKND